MLGLRDLDREEPVLEYFNFISKYKATGLKAPGTYFLI